MDFNKFFKEDLIVLDKEYKSKKDALEDFASILVQKKYCTDAKKVVELALKRENENSTGIGENIAIPHIRDSVVKESSIFFAKIKDLDWDSLDGQPVNYVFFILLNPEDNNSHMEILASLMKLFMNSEFKSNLKNVSSINQLIKLMNKYNEEEKIVVNENNSGNYDIVAITACPTGIAHTFMARDMLNKAAQEMNIKIKVETQGADGAKNVLTDEDIKNAKGVLIACDRVVELGKFSGHPNVLEMGTKPVIKDAKKEITRLLNNEGKQFVASSKTNTSSSEDQEMSFNGFGKRMYKSLMTGVSYMLPFVVFGGIMIAIAFLLDLENAGKDNYGSISNPAKWFKTIGDLSFGMLVPILAAYITFAIIGRQGLLPGFIVGLMAQGKFLFNLNVEDGTIDWFSPAGNNGGTSGIIGAIGGAFLAAVILIALVKYVFVYIPAILSGIKNILIIPLFGTLVIVAVFWILNIPLIYLNYGFNKFLGLMQGKAYLSWLLGMIIGAMMAFDLGGPINKAAYVFATTSLTTQGGGQGTIAMAAAMASGMTPPIGIALCCTFFKKLWTKDERQTGMLNYIMGLSFISEGAIPFTLTKPKVLVPANVIGGSVTGLIIGVIGVKIAAPHGGILTVALCKIDSNIIGGLSDGASIGLGISMFLVAIIIGSIVQMFSIVLLNKIFSNKNKKENKSSKKAKFSFKRNFARK